MQMYFSGITDNAYNDPIIDFSILAITCLFFAHFDLLPGG